MARIIQPLKPEVEAKILLLDASCETCIFNDDWEHPHDGDMVKDCKINNSASGLRKQGWCDKWKARSDHSPNSTIERIFNQTYIPKSARKNVS